ncbi:DNA topoisomerase IV subunit A [Holzapfeliella floricola]|uniref:DNA topoisomerase 4 subunit A n=1 Tax=Holzapfeliella floricola DSM 23037 = JCM 16512 TaxID=1423744 RepID=A0A0R2DHX4_9LACO|nr:DNA topoisomerase IV subunit A [Holzapfeliella floricola]KRN03695.1 DNA topoisomerase (ATP-hydrolyzing) subunit A [Holzapfeliella floricola DSM 23037 = JCM 16512]
MPKQAERIQEMSLEQIMGERFGRYSKYIIQERALPDIRDGLKPVQRRILYAMNLDHNTYDKGFRKSAKSVGNVMGNFHPHGDSSIYEAMVRLSQDWKLREPLIEMHGNNGSMDGDPPAAMRYTEARLSKIANALLADIDKDTVDMVLNFDDTENEPTVLPARFPNLLVNGATGISAGYATDIPTHNLTEVVNATIYLLDNPEATVDELMTYVKGPDFPTGGIIQGTDGIKQAYETGKGKIMVRSKTDIQELKGHRKQIVITEVPYEVNKANLVKKMDEVRINKKVEGISEVRDESDRSGLRIVVELKKQVDPHVILNYLFKNTDLQVSYNFNMVAINKMRPEQVGLKTILSSYLDHEQDVILRRTKYDLEKAKKRQHIVLGLIKGLSILNDVIKTIRASNDKKEAKSNLVKQFRFTDNQAEAIVSLPLYRLSNTDVNALEAEDKELSAKIDRFNDIINNQSSLYQVIKDQLLAVQKEFPAKRLSKIEAKVEKIEIDQTALIAEENTRVLISRNGYMKRSSLRSYQSSSETENGLKEEDRTILNETLSTLDHVFIFTNKGHVVYRPVHEIEDMRWKDTGHHISQDLKLEDDEYFSRVFTFNDLNQGGQFVLATDNGYVKQVKLEDVKPGRTYRSHATTVMKLKQGDATIVSTEYVESSENKEVLIITNHAYALRYDLSEVPTVGPKAVGVKSINLKDEDFVRDVKLLNSDSNASKLGILTQRGAYKQLLLAEIQKFSRAKRGILILRELKSKPHRIISTVMIEGEAKLAIITDKEKIIELITNNYPISDRYSNGSFVLDVKEQGLPQKMSLLEELNDNNNRIDEPTLF